MTSVAVSGIDLMRTVADVQRQLDILAFDLAPHHSELSDKLRRLYQQLEDASNVYAFGRKLGEPREVERSLCLVPDRYLDEVGER